MKRQELRKMRKLASLTQFQAATKSGISRMKLSLAECGQLELTQDEGFTVRRVLEEAVRKRATLMKEMFPDTETQAMPV